MLKFEGERSKLWAPTSNTFCQIIYKHAYTMHRVNHTSLSFISWLALYWAITAFSVSWMVETKSLSLKFSAGLVRTQSVIFTCPCRWVSLSKIWEKTHELYNLEF
jgi:hypothetical protein